MRLKFTAALITSMSTPASAGSATSLSRRNCAIVERLSTRSVLGITSHTLPCRPEASVEPPSRITRSVFAGLRWLKLRTSWNPSLSIANAGEVNLGLFRTKPYGDQTYGDSDRYDWPDHT